MGKKSNDRPKAPSAEETAPAQFRNGNFSVFSPTGNLVFGTTDANGNFVADPNATEHSAQIQETPFQSELRQTREGGTLDLINSILGQGMADRPTINDTSDIAKSIFDSALYNLKPQREQEDRRLIQNLSDRGIPLIGEAGSTVLDDIQRRRTGEEEQLMRGATQAAGSEQSRQYNLASDARKNSLSELITALTGVNPSQNTITAPTSTGIDMAGLISQACGNDVNAYNAEQDSKNALYGTLANVGVALLSDANAKYDIAPFDGSVLEGLRRLDILKWRYRPEVGLGEETHIGPMAQQFREVFGVGDGKTIALVDIVGVALAALKEFAEIVPDVRHA